MSSNQLAVANQASILATYNDVERAAVAMSRSGYFSDSREASQAIVKILAGQELGFGPFASMTGVYIISGRPSIGANLMAAAVKKSGRYNYRVVEMTDKACEIAFFEAGAEIGRSRFTIEDAKKAQTKNLDKFPRNMLFARAISNGVRWYCPDVFSGAPVYTPEEMGAVVDDEGRVLNVPENKNIIEGEISVPEPGGMADTGAKLGASVTEIDPLAAALEAAYEMTTPKGTPLRSLTIDQLTVVIENDKYSAELRDAACLVRDAKAADGEPS